MAGTHDISVFRASPDYQGCGVLQRNGTTQMSSPPQNMLVYRSDQWVDDT